MIDQKGSFHFGEAIVDNFGHICRLNTSVDVGIDAWIELVDANRSATGTYVPVQIKSTQDENEKDKVTHYIDDKHKIYWLQHRIPVVFAHVNVKKNRILIKDISIDNLERTDTQWKIDLSNDDELSIIGTRLFSRLARPHPNNLLYTRLRKLRGELQTYYIINHGTPELVNGMLEIDHIKDQLRTLLRVAQIDIPMYGHEICIDIQSQLSVATRLKSIWSQAHIEDTFY